MIRKFLTSVAVVGLVAGAANALELESQLGDENEPHPVAAQLDFAMGAVAGDVLIGFAAETGALPADDLVFFVDVTGATFTEQYDAGIDFAMAVVTAVTSSGGAKGSSSVVVSVDDADMCAESTGAGAADATCIITLPLLLDGTDVTVSVGIETDAGVGIDLTADDNQESFLAIDIVDAWDIDIIADTVPTVADLAALPGGPFTGFLGAPNDAILGTVAVAPNMIDYPPVGAAVTVNDGLTVSAVVAGDAGTIATVIGGTVDAFDDDIADPGNVLLAAAGCAVIDPTTDSATCLTLLADGATDAVSVVPDGSTPIVPSDYTATITVPGAPAGAGLLGPQVGAGSLQPIIRNGTTIVFPWTQTSTQGAASGTTSVYRFGNLDTDAVGEVFVEVKNSSEAGFVNPGIMSLAPSIDADGELVTTSSAIEALLGNYGRGDLEFTLEEASGNLTGRQFVVRGDVIQQVIGGTIADDQR